MAGSLWRGRALFSAPTRPFSARIWGRSRSKPTRCFVETEKRRSTNDHRLPRARGELNKHYPVWWIEELFHVWGVLACLNRRAAAPAAGSGTLDDLERCRVFRPLIDHLVDNAPLHRHFAGHQVSVIVATGATASALAAKAATKQSRSFLLQEAIRSNLILSTASIGQEAI